MKYYYEIQVTAAESLTSQQEDELKTLIADYFDFSEPFERVDLDLVDAD